MMTGQKIKELRNSRNVTQRDLGKLMGVSHATIAMWENSQRKVDLVHAKMLADIFNVTVDWLISEQEDEVEVKLTKGENMVAVFNGEGEYKMFSLNKKQHKKLLNFLDILSKTNQDWLNLTKNTSIRVFVAYFYRCIFCGRSKANSIWLSWDEVGFWNV